MRGPGRASGKGGIARTGAADGPTIQAWGRSPVPLSAAQQGMRVVNRVAADDGERGESPARSLGLKASGSVG
jgi:hypothetical protein